jgi:phage shock protein PspC (stress-responsive transcriptional regulator)
MDTPTDAPRAADAFAPPPGPRRLRRRPDDGHIAGVCAGVAEYFDIDPVIVRIAAVVLLFSGPGAFAYVLAWIFVPAEDGPAVHGAARSPIDRKDRATQVFGVVLIVLAVSVFWGDWWSPARHWLLPLGLMALGAWLLLRRDADGSPPPLPTAPPSTPVPPPAAWAWGEGGGEVTTPFPTAPEGADVTTTMDPPADDPTAIAEDPTEADGGAGGDDGEPPTAPWSSPGPVPPVPPEPPVPAVPLVPAPSRRRVLGPIVFGVLLIWAGIAFLGDVTLETGLAGGLLIIGVGFVFGAFVGGSRVLILPALLVGAALAVTAVVDIPLDGPVGQQRWTPGSLEDLDDRYEVSLGEGTLDLTALTIPEGDRVAVDVSVGVGHLVVLVPVAMAADVTTDLGAGESIVFGQRQEGVDITTDQSVTGGPSSGTIDLDLEVGLGQIEVRRSPDIVSGEAPTVVLPPG